MSLTKESETSGSAMIAPWNGVRQTVNRTDTNRHVIVTRRRRFLRCWLLTLDDIIGWICRLIDWIVLID